MKRLLFLVFVLAASVLPVRAATSDKVPLDAWQQLPVQQNGRIMPLDTYARNLLLSFSGRSTFDRKPASLWLARVFFTPDATREDKIFLINNPEVLEGLGLQADGRGRYSQAQLQPVLAELTRLSRAAFHLEQKERTPVDIEFMQLFNNLDTYNRLCEGFGFALPRPELVVLDVQLRRDLGLGEGKSFSVIDVMDLGGRIAELRAASTNGRATYNQELGRLSMSARMLSQRHGSRPPMLFPGGGPDSTWIGPWEALSLSERGGYGKELGQLKLMASAFREGRYDAFAQACSEFDRVVHQRAGAEKQLSKIGMEVRYNRIDPFYRSELLYGFAFLLALVSVPVRNRWLYGVAAGLTALALVPHTYGIIARMLIMGRPPVTNLYTTFVFVAWTSALLGLAMEYVQRNRLGLIVATASGLALLLTSGRFADGDDTMGVMVAVLDSNFWLATHVVTISMGYAGCCAAGLLGHIYLLQAIRRDPADASLLETYRAVFGLQAFGLIFSFVGTMLGGVWADQSWGRFWGWDPKENGALVIVLWSATLFHARAGGMIRHLGFAAGSVLGIIAVLLAWLGVNLLGVGLHSYGFTSGIARGLMLACGLEILFVAVVMPFSRSWRSTGGKTG